MPFHPFQLERWQSTWETRVRYNLSESGVAALTAGELRHLTAATADELDRVRLGYGQSDGDDELRAAIAALYPGATGDNVIVTVGSAEANYVLCWALIRPRDRVVVVTPTYMQIPGLTLNFGAAVTRISLRPEAGWEPDPDDVHQAVTRGTRLVVVTNPNNPTGHALTEAARMTIVERARQVGAWLLVDEVYQGAELDGPETRSFWGSYERVIVVNGLSKAYGLPGLRIGWIVCPSELKTEILLRHDYTVIGVSPLNAFLASRALGARSRILERTRTILTTNYPILEGWLRQFADRVEWWKPDCGAICFARCGPAVDTIQLVERVRAECDVLLVPGDHFEQPHHLRFGYGAERETLEEALGALAPALGRIL
jgi:aspartate/methionine/tyrosine aminotransferase